MKILLPTLIFFFPSILAYFNGVDMYLVSGQCQNDQQSLLLQMKNSLIFNYTVSVNLMRWSPTTDCCDWSGVGCDGAGHVISLNLSNESISGGIENATGLFSLKHLQSLNLAFNTFNGTQIPSPLANLTNLSYLNLSNAGFTGQIPGTISGMTRLVTFDFSFNQFYGPIPSFQMFRNLSYLNVSHNLLTGSISSTCWEQLSNLVYVDFTSNSLKGIIPPSLFALPSLQKLQLANNQFEGLVPEFSNASSSVLDTLDLSGNKIQGPVPMSLFELKKLQVLLLSSNKFNGTINLGTCQRLGHLTTLDLSHKSLTVNVRSRTSYFPPKISTLRLASCNMDMILNLKNHSRLFLLDLSDNKISGEIPNWIWEVGNGALTHLNLSHNLLTGMEEPYSIPSLKMLDLHSNQLQGRIPHPPPTALYVDYSNNKFSSSIPVDIGNALSSTIFFSVSNNSLKGVIPESICDVANLQALDLSCNNFSGSVPLCLIERSETLGVLNLRRNKIGGTLSGTFPKNCGLQTLDLNGNELEGMLPRSLANCSKLEVLDLGNNRISDSFPCWLRKVSNLHVLVLRSNNFYGSIDCLENNVSWPLLQIVDIASNNFSGGLPKKFMMTWKAMMVDESIAQSNKQLRYQFRGFSQLYYQDTVTVISKAQRMKIEKILTIFTSIDLSCNNFQGSLPEEIGLFRALHMVNLSYNSFTGTIPSSVGELRQLESLDISMNNLSGEIPIQVVNLNFLSVVNISYNHFVGRIPFSTQIQSFSTSSFIGNDGLCGPPLTKECINSSMIVPPSTLASSNEIDWWFIEIVVAFLIGFGAIVVPLIFSEKVNKWYDDCVIKLLEWFGIC